MSEQITLDAEFLRRALGQGLGEDPADMVVTPDELPSGFPVVLPDFADVRVLGGVRSLVVHWTSGPHGRPAELTTWRVFLDVSGSPPDVMRALTTHLEGQGWQRGQMWRQAFVEASADQWMGVHPEQARTLMLQLRGMGRVTQFSLSVQDVERENMRHLLGHEPPFHPLRQLPLSTLTAPGGWRVQLGSGSGGETERSERALLLPPEGEAVNPGVLLAHFRPQLERQGWNVLHAGEEEASVYLTGRTDEGVGVLTLMANGGVGQAALLHVALRPTGPGGYSAVSSYTLTS